MTEDEARAWVAARFPDQFDQVATFLNFVQDENDRQNLIAPSTVPHIWARHAVDSLQLISDDVAQGLWTDIGTGGGFPGMVVAIVRAAPIRLLEPRQKRAQFLRECAARLALCNVEVIKANAETVEGYTDVISARAVAGLDTLIDLGRSWATTTTRWILPRGRLSDDDMAVLLCRFENKFHVEHSATAADSSIVIAQGMPV